MIFPSLLLNKAVFLNLIFLGLIIAKWTRKLISCILSTCLGHETDLDLEQNMDIESSFIGEFPMHVNCFSGMSHLFMLLLAWLKVEILIHSLEVGYTLLPLLQVGLVICMCMIWMSVLAIVLSCYSWARPLRKNPVIIIFLGETLELKRVMAFGPGTGESKEVGIGL